MRLKLAILVIYSLPFIKAFADDGLNNKLDTYYRKLTKLESLHKIHIGAYAIDTGNNYRVSFNESRRFPFCSTVKFMSVAALLKKSESDHNYLNQVINYTESDVNASGYAPISSKHINNGMTLLALSEAALNYSDNTAQNLIVKNLGGIKSVNNFAKLIGDNVFSLNRNEPKLNTAIPNDKRDTTTPQAMTNSMRDLLVGNVLNLKQKSQLITWLKNNKTGKNRIQAGLPDFWMVGDKTGTGDYGTANDIAIIYPPNCAPIILSIYTTQDKKSAKPQEKILAKTTEIIMQELAKNNSCIKNSLVQK